MKIYYGAGNRIGSANQLARFLEHSKHHNVVTSAWNKSSYMVSHVNWLIDPIYSKRCLNPIDLENLMGHKKVPRVEYHSLAKLLSEVADFAPDLIISEFEPISAHIAKALDVRLWYCSPALLLKGTSNKNIKYQHLFENSRKQAERYLPAAEKYLIYSPIGDLDNTLPLKENYEWTSPFAYSLSSEPEYDLLAIVNSNDRFTALSKLLNCSKYKTILASNFREEFDNMSMASLGEDYKQALDKSLTMLNLGDTNFIADALYSGKRICISPAVNDIESLLNACILEKLNVATDISQIEFMDKFSLDYLERGVDNAPENNAIIRKNKTLIERIDECI